MEDLLIFNRCMKKHLRKWLFSSQTFPQICQGNVLNNLIGLCPVTRCCCISLPSSVCFVSSLLSLSFCLLAKFFFLFFEAQWLNMSWGKAMERLCLTQYVKRIATYSVSLIVFLQRKKQTIYVISSCEWAQSSQLVQTHLSLLQMPD